MGMLLFWRKKSSTVTEELTGGPPLAFGEPPSLE
jgi:hypothetical protein